MKLDRNSFFVGRSWKYYKQIPEMKLGHGEIVDLFMNCKLRLQALSFVCFLLSSCLLASVSFFKVATVLLRQISLLVHVQWERNDYEHRYYIV